MTALGNTGETMQVTVRLYAGLGRRRAANQGAWSDAALLEAALPVGATISDLIASLALPADEIKVIFVNGRVCPQTRPLADGDRVGIFPPIGGG
jgi:sulfur carrier protein ThiS